MEVQEERKYAIEAAIVRTMKMNRTMKLQPVRPTTHASSPHTA
jgi:hypothetical protein